MDARPKGNVAAERVYEEFEPTMEWVREPGADTLLLYLPGFKKEQMKVQVTSSRSLRISGERQLSDNRWSRFRKEIPIESNYDPNEITAKFEKGILFVRQPKLIVPGSPRPQGQEQPPVEATKPDQNPPQETAQPSIQAPSTPDKKPPAAQEKGQPPMPQKPVEQPEKQPQVKLKQLIEDSRNENPTSERKPEEPVPKIAMERQKNGKTGGEANANNNVLPKAARKEREPIKSEWKEKSTTNGLAEAERKDIATTSKSAKPEDLGDSTQMEKDEAATGLTSGKEKLRMENYRKTFSALVMDLTKPRKWVNLILVILCFVVLGMYGRSAIRSLRKHEN